MIERLFDIKYPDLGNYLEEWHIDIYARWQVSFDYMNVELFLETFYPVIWTEYQEFIKDYVKDFFRDLLKQEKE